jgi:hypothetical protein
VHPDHKPFLVVSFRGKFYIDHTHPFGARPASSNSGMIGNAITDIWKAEGIDEIFKYEDDMDQMRVPIADGPFTDGQYKYRHDVDSSLALISSLGVPWHPTKTGKHFDFIMTFIGFLWNLQLRRVSLPEKKRLKYLDRINRLLDKAALSRKVTLFDIRQIHGTLVHVCFVYRDGSSRLPPISNFESSFKGNFPLLSQNSFSISKVMSTVIFTSLILLLRL